MATNFAYPTFIHGTGVPRLIGKSQGQCDIRLLNENDPSTLSGN